MSADGAHGLTIIAFIGSVFSPYYAFARSRGRGDPENHVSMNVALYGRPKRWAMTERGRTSLRRDETCLEIGASAMQWDGETLTVTIAETTAPLPSKLKGTIRLRPRALTRDGFELDARGGHRWQPLAPSSDVEVSLTAPGLSWRGTGYFDTNSGDEPLEHAFRSWTWSRFDLGAGARIVYDSIDRQGVARPLSLRIGASGDIELAQPLSYSALPRGFWGVERHAPADPGAAPKLVRTLEDAPFYNRSEILSQVDGVTARGVHETLLGPRVAAPWVRMMLPFRMPRFDFVR